MRPTFPEIYMKLARLMAQRSTCVRRSVGTVITSADGRQVLSVGYNGNATGLPNTCDSDEVGACGCLHSEDNACLNNDSPRYVEKIIYVTTMPCKMCAKRFINLGNVKKVYYADAYRNEEGLRLLEQVGIEIVQLKVPSVDTADA